MQIPDSQMQSLAQYIDDQLCLATAFEAIGHADDALVHFDKALIAEEIANILGPDVPIVHFEHVVEIAAEVQTVFLDIPNLGGI